MSFQHRQTPFEIGYHHADDSCAVRRVPETPKVSCGATPVSNRIEAQKQRLTVENHLIIADRMVEQYRDLLIDLPETATVVTLPMDATLDDLAAAVKGHDNLTAIHLISHGQEGAIHLGRTVLSQDNLAQAQDALREVGAALCEGGDILLYGCNIGKGTGRAFVAEIAAMTGANVAASTTLTGAPDAGGDWDLQVSVGPVQTAMILSAKAKGTFPGVLPVSDEDFDSAGFVSTTATDIVVGDWTFATNVLSDFEVTTSGETQTNLNGGSDRSLRMNAAEDGSVTTFTIRTTDGSDFDLASMAISDVLQTNFSIEGFRDGVSVVGSELVDSDVSDSIGNIHYSFTATTVDGSHGDLTFQSAYDNVDEIRITVAATNAIDIDDIIASVANSAPDLGGTPADDTATEDVATAIDLSAYNVSDADGDTITLTLAVDRGTIGSIDGDGTTAGVTIANSGTASMTLQGTAADLNTYLNDTSKITYTTALNDTTTATLTVTPNDGALNGTADTVNIAVSAVNDAPTQSGLPSDVTVTEDAQSNIDFSALSFADVDSASITVTLTASAGTFAPPANGAGVGGGVTEVQVNATTITLAGSPADISTYLDTASNLQYTPVANANGNDQATITVTANDGDGSGDVNFGSVNIDVTAVNDDPTIATLPAAVTVTEDTQSTIDLSSTSFADIDSASITVTLTASAGTFATPADGAGVGGGVTETLQSATVITLVGSPADITTYLDTASNIQYTSAANVSGNAAVIISVTANDGDGSGDVNMGNVNINVTPVNDDPTIATLPAGVTVTEDTQSNVALGAAALGDVDGDTLTVTLNASAGTFATPADSTGVGAGVTETLVNATTITLVGSAADINTYLDTASNIQYTAAANVNGSAAATITVTANDGAGSGDVNLGTVNVDVTAINDDPEFSNLDGTPTFIEDGSAQILDADVTIFDVEASALNGGNGDFDGTALGLARDGGTNTNDVFSIQTSGNLTVAGSDISAGGNIFATFDTTTTAGLLTVTFTNANGTTPTTALVNEVMQAIRHADTSDDPASSAEINWLFSDGSGGLGTGSTTTTVTNVNDAPTLTATGGNPTYIENGGAQDLFNTVSASTIEQADRFTSLELTVTNVSDGASEILSFDGSDVALTNGNSVTTATNGLSVSVSVLATTATVSFSGGALSGAQMQTLVDGLTYRNLSEVPTTTGNRVATITNICDDGGTANGGDATATPNLTSTITVSASNDDPTLADFGPDTGNVGYTPGSSTFVAFDGGTPADLSDAELDALNAGSGNFNGATITFVRNGGADTTDRFGISGGTTALDNGATVTIAGTDIGTVTSGSAASGTITISLNSNATSGLVDIFFQSIGYINSSGSATGMVTIDVTFDDGNTGTQGSGGALSLTEQVTVAIGNAPVIGNVSGDTASFTEDGGPIVVDQGADATATEVDAPANLNGGNLAITVTGNANVAQDVLSFSSTGGFVALGGTTAGSTVSVDLDSGGDGFVQVGTLANTIAAGNPLQVNLNTNATLAHTQTLMRNATYDNTSADPTTADRTVSFVLTDDTGRASTAATATVSVDPVNDAPGLTAIGADPTYLEGAAASDLFGTVSATTIEAADSFQSLELTLTNLSDGASEILNVDGSDIALTDGTNVTTATNGLSASVAVAGSTATLTLSGASATNAEFEALVDGISYRNTSDAPTTGVNRVVTLTEITDDGGTANGGVATTPLALASTITLQGVNDAPVIANLDGDRVTVAPGSTANIDASRNATVVEPNTGSLDGGSLQIVDNGGNNSASGDFRFDGVVVTAGGDGAIAAGETVEVNGVSVGTVAAADGQAGNGLTLNLAGVGATSAAVQALLQNLQWGAATGDGDQTFSLTLDDDQGTANGGVSDTSVDFTMALNTPTVVPTGGGNGGGSTPTPPPADDGDGIDALVEAGVPNPSGTGIGDGNADGTPDTEQSNVTSFLVPAANDDTGTRQSYITLGVGDDANLREVSVVTSPVDADLPDGLQGSQFPFGVFAFDIENVDVGGTETISVFVPGDVEIAGYLKQDANGDWVSVPITVTTVGNRQKISFDIVDGGPLDTNPASGVIGDPGGPIIAHSAEDPPVVSPDIRADADGDGAPDAVEAARGTDPMVKDNDVFGNTEYFVDQAYRDILMRDADDAGRAYYADLLDRGVLSRGEVMSDLGNSEEFETGVGAVSRLHQALFDRAGDLNEITASITPLQESGDIEAAATALTQSAEYLADVEWQGSEGLSNEDFVERAYTNIFERDVDSAGQAFWSALLDTGFERSAFLNQLAQSDEFKSATDTVTFVNQAYLGILDRNPDTDGFAFWSDAHDGSDAFDASLVSTFLATDEFAAIVGVSAPAGEIMG